MRYALVQTHKWVNEYTDHPCMWLTIETFDDLVDAIIERDKQDTPRHYTIIQVW